MSKIISYSVDESIEATALSVVERNGLKPVHDPRSSRIGLVRNEWVEAPDFSPGERAFKPAENGPEYKSGFTRCGTKAGPGVAPDF